jgi:GT2 family glycosyltransferase/glycosyltransferase involved in cell wall biosynthesis
MSAAPPEIRCDVVVPVYNALRSTRNCLASLKKYAPAWCRIVVINDGSDARTTEWLRAQEGIVLLENPENVGFVKTANRGLLYSDSPWVCLLNSDTLMTEGALERMLAGCERDETIGLCCPLSNEAVNLSVKVPPGGDVFSLARRVARAGEGRYPDAVTVVGFCLLVNRRLIRELGVLDEIYGRGYCEETDLHYRARSAGWRCVVADDTFVYHRHHGSFTDGTERMWKNMEILMGRWRALHEKEIAEFNRRNDLGSVRDAETTACTLPGDPEPFDVLFVLPMMGVFGGVASVLELTNALLLEGVHAGVVVLSEHLTEIDMELFFQPLRIAPDALADRCPPTRLLVATAYQTAAHVAIAAARRPGMRTAYFLQDYEGWFGEANPDYVEATYRLLPCLTAVSTWLADEIRTRHGLAAPVVPISADPELFYPRGNRAATGVRIAAMLRPDERRGARFVIPALAGIGRRPGVEVVFFGTHEVPEAAALPHCHLGTLSREKVAELFSTVHIVVDPSLFQGFGLVGLEGMASGAACVLTDSGGVREYAVDGENALLVPPRDEKALEAAIQRLVGDADLRERLGRAGLATARRFTWKRTAEAYRAFMDGLPEPLPFSPHEAAALDLLRLELCRDTAREETLRAEVNNLRGTLDAVARSPLYRFTEPYRRLRAWWRR